MSSSRSEAAVFTPGNSALARPSRRLVSPLIADGTTIIWWPARAHLATRLATLRMRSVDPIEVPPYLWTMSAMLVFRREPRILAARHPVQGHLGLARQRDDAR